VNPLRWLERWIHRGTEGWIPDGADPKVMAALEWSDTDSGRVLIERARVWIDEEEVTDTVQQVTIEEGT
jgi:hypothetical protein